MGWLVYQLCHPYGVDDWYGFKEVLLSVIKAVAVAWSIVVFLIQMVKLLGGGRSAGVGYICFFVFIGLTFAFLPEILKLTCN